MNITQFVHGVKKDSQIFKLPNTIKKILRGKEYFSVDVEIETTDGGKITTSYFSEYLNREAKNE